MNRGFSIIELLITITILSMLVSVTLATYNRFNLRQGLITAGQTMKSTLRDAQSRTTNGEVDCAICDCVSSGPSSTGWFVDFAQKEMYGECDGTPYFQKPFTLSSDIFITPFITPPDRIRFRFSPPGIDGNATICLVHKDLPDSFYRIQINEAGGISDTGTVDASCIPE